MINFFKSEDLFVFDGYGRWIDELRPDGIQGRGSKRGKPPACIFLGILCQLNRRKNHGVTLAETNFEIKLKKLIFKDWFDILLVMDLSGVTEKIILSCMIIRY
jgi:hypothetical protein